MGLALRAQNNVGRRVEAAARNVAAVSKHPDPVGIFEDHAEVIILVAVLRLEADLSSPEPPRFDGRDIPERPRTLVDAVDQLLARLIARQPVEVVPVTELELEFAPLRIAFVSEIRTADVVLLHGDDIADRSILHAFHGLAYGLVIPPAQTGNDCESFLFGRRAGFFDQFDTGHVERMGLLAEYMFTGGDGGLQVLRMEVRGSRDQHDVDVGGQQLLVGVEPGEQLIVRDLYLIRLGLLQSLAGRGQFVGEQIGHGDQLDVLAGVHGVHGGAAAASSAADQADAEAVGPCGMSGPCDTERQSKGGTGRQRRFQERATSRHGL